MPGQVSVVFAAVFFLQLKAGYAPATAQTPPPAAAISESHPSFVGTAIFAPSMRRQATPGTDMVVCLQARRQLMNNAWIEQAVSLVCVHILIVFVHNMLVPICPHKATIAMDRAELHLLVSASICVSLVQKWLFNVLTARVMVFTLLLSFGTKGGLMGVAGNFVLFQLAQKPFWKTWSQCRMFSCRPSLGRTTSKPLHGNFGARLGTPRPLPRAGRELLIDASVREQHFRSCRM